jgi:hypothetical protein
MGWCGGASAREAGNGSASLEGTEACVGGATSSIFRIPTPIPKVTSTSNTTALIYRESDMYFHLASLLLPCQVFTEMMATELLIGPGAFALESGVPEERHAG